MVQGPQLKIITAALEEKGVPKKYIEFLDKTKKR
jgi:translation initiation factor 2D